VSLVARYLEANGLPTVIVGSALDIVELCGVPRFLFTDFPLGNPCGPPWQRDLQRSIVAQAIGLLSSAGRPRTTVRSPIEWPGDDPWRPRYGRVAAGDREHLLAQGEERRQRQTEAARKATRGDTRDVTPSRS
jgi:D-proline reductase (dithiol) PrdB